jgi:excisionase family DNA binding protein
MSRPAYHYVPALARGPMKRLAKAMIQREAKTASLLTQKHYTCREVAAICGMDPQTIRRYVVTGKLNAWRIGGRGQWRIDEDEVKRLTAGRISNSPHVVRHADAQETT